MSHYLVKLTFKLTCLLTYDSSHDPDSSIHHPGVGAGVEHVELLGGGGEGVHLDQPFQHHHDPVAPQLHRANLGMIIDLPL